MFSYKVKIDDGSDGYTDLGIVAGSTFAEASALVEKYFEGDDIISLELFSLLELDGDACIMSLAEVEKLSDLFQKTDEEKFLGY